MNLNVKSYIKTIADNDIGTDRGGISWLDSPEHALFYLCNFDGNFGESNGFEVTRNDNLGEPCITLYTTRPTPHQLQNTSITVTSDTAIQIVIPGPFPDLHR